MIWQALSMVEWWQYALLALAAACLVLPACSLLERRSDRLDREVWARMPGATE